MEDQTIKRLRNKFWMFLMSIFSILTILILIVVYGWRLSSIQQDWYFWFRSTSFEEQIREGKLTSTNERPHDYLTIKINRPAQMASVFSDYQLDLSQFENLVELAVNPAGTVNKNSDTWWMQMITPIMEIFQPNTLYVGGRHWVYTFIDSLSTNKNDLSLEPLYEFEMKSEIFNTDATEVYLVFGDVTPDIDDLNAMRLAFSKIGIVVFVIFMGISLIFVNMFMKPMRLAFERQKQFVADASHELKTPLSIIQNNFGVLMANRKETVESQMQWLNYMEFGCERMSTLTQDLLMLAQLESSDFKLKKQLFDLTESSEAIIQMMMGKMMEKNISLSTHMEPNLMIKQDPDKIMQVMVILFDNAIKYANESGWIRVEMIKVRQRIKITIKNSGPGIPSDKLPKIFERFYRSDESRNSKSGSYGLGLAIAKEIIKKSGGKIHVASIENQVTTFTIFI